MTQGHGAIRRAGDGFFRAREPVLRKPKRIFYMVAACEWELRVSLRRV